MAECKIYYHKEFYAFDGYVIMQWGCDDHRKTAHCLNFSPEKTFIQFAIGLGFNGTDVE